MSGARLMLAALAEGAPVEVLRVGSFVDMHGTDVDVDVAFLDAMVSNFDAGAAGQDVPIDVDHELGEAAGWVTRIWREGERLLATVDWNELGVKLVGEKLYRYVSAYIDMVGKVLRSVSLVNFPAVKGLAPVELKQLAEGVYGFKDVPVRDVLRARMHQTFVGAVDQLGVDGVIDEAMRQRALSAVESAVDAFYQALEGLEATTWRPDSADVYFVSSQKEGHMDEVALREQIRNEVMAEIQARQVTEAALREQLRAELLPQIEAEVARHQELVAFAAEVTSGAVALAMPADEVVAFLEALPVDQIARAQAMLKAKIVELGERGSAGSGRGDNQVVTLDAPILAALREWVAAGGKVAEFFTVNKDELGEMAQYDLSEFAA